MTWPTDQPGYTLMHIPVRLVETVQGIANGSLVAVPREPTPAIWAAVGAADDVAFAGGSAHGADFGTLWAVALAAAKDARHD